MREIQENGLTYLVQGDYPKGKYTKSIKPTAQAEANRAKAEFNTVRNMKFSKTEWTRQRHNDRIELHIDDTENWLEWLSFWQALRDMPQQEKFNALNPNWPEQPK